MTARATKRDTAATAGAILTLIFTLACPPPFGGDRIPEAYAAFFKLPLDQRRDSIRQYPIDEQIELYLIALRAKHPPQTELAYDVASSGAAAIPAILNRFETPEDEFTKSDLMLILEDMVCFHGVELRTTPALMDTLRASTATIRHKLARSRAEESLQVISDGCVARRAHARKRFSRPSSDSND